MIVVVLGMHKSGTTLVARLLHDAGIAMQDPGVPTGGSYDSGEFLERRSTRSINLALLGSGTHAALDPPPPVLHLAPETERRIRDLVADLTGADWGFKDPRTALTYPAWAEALPPHRVVGIYRPVADLWPRFRYEGIRRAHTNPVLARRLVRRWCEYNERVLAVMRDPTRPALLLSYDELMTGTGELDRLGAFVGRPVPDRRRPDLNRGRAQRAVLVSLAARLEASGGTNVRRVREDLDEVWRAQQEDR